MVEFHFFHYAFITRRIAKFLFINCNQKYTKKYNLFWTFINPHTAIPGFFTIFTITEKQ